LERLDYPKKLFRVALVDCHVLPGLKEFFAEKLQNYDFRVIPLSLTENPMSEITWLHEARLNEARNYAMERIPGRYYAFTEDDCMLQPDWLRKFETALTDEIGALGGPDILPEGMGWFPRAFDCILSSFFGTLGAKRGNVSKENWYHPRKDNMMIPATVFERVGSFPEKMIFGAEMEMAKRIREAGFRIKYLPDNFVLHRRVTTLPSLMKRNAFMSAEKVRLLRKRGAFSQSPHFLVLMAAMASALIGLIALIASPARTLLAVLIITYIAILLFVTFSSLIRSRSLSVGFGVLLLMPLHHLSIACGTIHGAVTKINPI
jgi:hypothetical protein